MIANAPDCQYTLCLRRQGQIYTKPGSDVIKRVSCSTQLSMKFQLLIKQKNTDK